MLLEVIPSAAIFMNHSQHETDDFIITPRVKSKPTMNKPVMSDGVESDVLDAISQYQNRDKWIQWGMNNIREQGSAILLEGPSGTGKTTIAKWMAERIKKGFKQLSAAQIGGGEPGATERAVVEFFADAKKRHNATIFIDECDHLLGNREKISPDGKTWQLGTIETLMMEMNVYSGLVICATNHVHNLDPALSNRFLAIVHVGEPDFPMRVKLWRHKIPKKLPFQPSEGELKKLAKYELNGRQIETVIVAAISNAIRRNVRPSLGLFIQFCERENGKHIVAE